MSTRHLLNSEGAVVCTASPADDGGNVTSDPALANCDDCMSSPTRCPVCQKDAFTITQKDGLLKAHSRPVEIPGGVASTLCSGSGLKPEPTPMPDWLRRALSQEA